MLPHESSSLSKWNEISYYMTQLNINMASESHKFISRIRSENCASAAASLPNAETCLRRAGVATTATACLPRTKTKPDAATKTRHSVRLCVCVLPIPRTESRWTEGDATLIVTLRLTLSACELLFYMLIRSSLPLSLPSSFVQLVKCRTTMVAPPAPPWPARCAAATAVPMAITSIWILCATARHWPMPSPARRSCSDAIVDVRASPWSSCWASRVCLATIGRRRVACSPSWLRWVFWGLLRQRLWSFGNFAVD